MRVGGASDWHLVPPLEKVQFVRFLIYEEFRLRKLYELLRDKLIWGAFITLFLKSYLKLFVTSALGVQEEEKSQGERLVPFCMLLILSIAPLFMLTGLANLRNHYEKPDVIRKYGALTLNLRTDEAPGYLYNFFYILRRMIYGLSLAFMGSNPSTQVMI